MKVRGVGMLMSDTWVAKGRDREAVVKFGLYAGGYFVIS